MQWKKSKLYIKKINFDLVSLLIKKLLNLNIDCFSIIYIKKNLKILGIGDWGLGIGDWGLGPIPHPQSPNPNPQSPKYFIYFFFFLYFYKII